MRQKKKYNDRESSIKKMKTEKIVKYKERQRNVVKDKEREIKKNKE